MCPPTPTSIPPPPPHPTFSSFVISFVVSVDVKLMFTYLLRWRCKGRSEKRGWGGGGGKAGIGN